MPVRRFLVAPAIARLLRRELSGAQVIEGHFHAGHGPHVYVRAEGDDYRLVLKAGGGSGAATQEAVAIPKQHADALFEASAGRVTYHRFRVEMDDGHTAVVDSFSEPGGLDVVEVAFADQTAADGFATPLWFGADVTDCDNQTIAVNRLSVVEDIPITSATVEAALDALEHQELRSLLGREAHAAPARSPTDTSELRQLHARMLEAVPAAEAGDDASAADPRQQLAS